MFQRPILFKIRSLKGHLRYCLSGLCAAAILSACSPIGFDTLQEDLLRTAQQQVLSTLAGRYTQELGKGVTHVVARLAEPGGYLDNPIARILLPPPVGMALGVMQDLTADPSATLLSVLINQAAERAIPGAAPILQAALMQITPTEALQLLDGDLTAGTQALKEKTLATLHAALSPLISEQLAGSGAQLVYKEILDTSAMLETPVTDMPDIHSEPVSEPVKDLSGYVTDQAIAGLFAVLGEQEQRMRTHLDELRDDLWQGIGQMPAIGGQQ